MNQNSCNCSLDQLDYSIHCCCYCSRYLYSGRQSFGPLLSQYAVTARLTQSAPSASLTAYFVSQYGQTWITWWVLVDEFSKQDFVPLYLSLSLNRYCTTSFLISLILVLAFGSLYVLSNSSSCYLSSVIYSCV